MVDVKQEGHYNQEIKIGEYVTEKGDLYLCYFYPEEKEAEVRGPVPQKGGFAGIAFLIEANSIQEARRKISKELGPGEWQEIIQKEGKNESGVKNAELIEAEARRPNYWWINAETQTWIIEDYKNSKMDHTYTSINKEGKKRRIYKYFMQVQPGDLAIGYQTSPINRVIALFRITKGLHYDENGREIIKFRNLEFFPNQITLSELRQIKELSKSEFIRNPQGSLLKLLPDEFNAVITEARKKEKIGRRKKQPVKKKKPKKEVVTFDQYAEFNIRKNQTPAIGVEELAQEVAKMIYNLQPSDTGKMVGIFGQWGRGKTFLMEQIWKSINDNYKNKFFRVNFQAWKYQDTPASWAYLYEGFAKEYYETRGKKWFFRKISEYRKLLKLNTKRIGYWPFIVLFFLLAFYTLQRIDLLPIFKIKLNLASDLAIGGIFLIGLYNFYLKFKNQAVNFFNKYFKKPTFKDVLGIQAEIQTELKKLLMTWISQKEVEAKNRRILLVVDDVDRCSEERLIQIIDSLRVLLENEEISRRVIAMIAIDERVLQRAIRWKYHNLLETDYEIQKKPKKKLELCNTLSREYMDKLFIAGIKLSTITTRERKEIFEVFTRGTLEQKEEEKHLGEEVPEEGEEPGTGGPGTFPPPSVPNLDEVIKPERNFELSLIEFDEINTMLDHFDGATPRQIRILQYRYLLARNLLDQQINKLDEKYHKKKAENLLKLPEFLINYSCKKSLKEFLVEKNKILSRSTKTASVNLITGQYREDTEILAEILNILEMVIAY